MWDFLNYTKNVTKNRTKHLKCTLKILLVKIPLVFYHLNIKIFLVPTVYALFILPVHTITVASLV